MKKNLYSFRARYGFLFGVFLLIFILPLTASAATLVLSPSSTGVNVNSTFTVNILLDTSGQTAYGVDVNRLHFNPSILQVVDADSGTSGVQITPGSLMPTTETNTVDNVGGTIQFSQLANPGTTFTGSGTLATITFKGVAGGTSAVTFDFTPGNTTDSNVAGLNSDLLTAVTNGSYTSTPLDTTPPVISTVSATGITTTAATITWTTNESSDSQVEYGLTTAYGNTSALNSTLVTSHTVALSSLSSNTLYHYRVDSRDAAGNLALGVDNTFTTATPPDVTPPTVSVTAPANNATVSGSVFLSANASDNVAVASVQFTVDGLNAGSADLVSPYSTVWDSSAVANGSHTIRAIAKDTSNNFATSTVIIVTVSNTIPDTTPPTAPTNLTASNTTSTATTLSWTASTDNVLVSGYKVYRSGVQIATANTTTYTDSTLSPASAYSYAVTAYDAAGNESTQSNIAAITTPALPDTTAPSVPTGLTATAASSTAIDLIWAASSDPVIAGSVTSGVSGYKIFRGGVQVGTSGTNSYTNAGLSASTNYTYTVSAYDGAGNASVQSSSANATTPSGVPLAGDLNLDHVVNSLDFSLLNSKWLQNYPAYDLYVDGIINSLDFAIMSNNWGKIW